MLSPSRCLIAIGAFGLLLTGHGLADDAPALRVETDAPVFSPAKGEAVAPVATSEFGRRVEELREAFRVRLTELTAQYKAAVDAERAASLQRAISVLKLDLEIQLLELQQEVLAASDAPASAKTDASERLEAALHTLRLLRGEQE
jgi:hypothetical protein